MLKYLLFLNSLSGQQLPQSKTAMKAWSRSMGLQCAVATFLCFINLVKAHFTVAYIWKWKTQGLLRKCIYLKEAKSFPRRWVKWGQVDKLAGLEVTIVQVFLQSFWTQKKSQSKVFKTKRSTKKQKNNIFGRETLWKFILFMAPWQFGFILFDPSLTK